ncbi:AraC family transcriptional regulator [Williamsia limnetica]|uniref:AraC family transcriptional regulator n=1 Tax=Williamsia limnetica TaxID=882452 RepID=A0A318RKX7_WILLI|nr:helix-turn-helix domain-containing protein [Williamsia limnetica]PYE11835.1 AraC family transcriptional regulator [Williamsia limnetica]
MLRVADAEPLGGQERFWALDDLPAAERFDYWRSVICEAYTPLTPRRRLTAPPAGVAAGFADWVRSVPLASTQLTEIASLAQQNIHGAREVSRTSVDAVFVNLMLEGSCVGSQDGRDCVIGRGEFALFDATRPFTLDYPESWRALSFRVRRSELVHLIEQPDTFTATTHTTRVPGGACAAITAATMTAIWSGAMSLEQSAAASTNTAFMTLLSSCIDSAGVLAGAPDHDAQALVRASVNRYLAAHLQHGDLSVGVVARRFAMSPRKLHALYEGHDLSFAQTVMRLRVEACARDLENGSGAVSLTSVASKWGFCDLSHLNRVFRAHMGCRPSDFRAKAQDAAAAAL